MKLVSLQIDGKEGAGWSSERHVFSDRITQILGDNGAGKTPLVRSIVFALGYKVDFQDDILQHCDKVRLEVRVDDRSLLITRSLHTPFWIEVDEGGKESAEFSSEREFTRFLLSLWGLEDPVVTTTNNKPSHIYSSQLLPLFYLDQSHGYAVDYYTNQSKFIKDQYAEATRLVSGLAPKNAFDRRRMRFELQERLEYLDRSIIRSETIMSDLIRELAGERRPVVDLVRELEEAQANLASLQESTGAPDQVAVELDANIAGLQRRAHELSRERADLDARMRGYAQIKTEIEAESDTLLLNEEARRVFSAFDSICANDNCGLFIKSSVSYGKSLLYLKDQVKDIERNSATCGRRAREIGIEVDRIREQIEQARAARVDLSKEGSAISALVELAGQLTERVIGLRRAIQIEGELSRVEEEYVAKIDDRSRVQSQLAGLEHGKGAADLELLRLRSLAADRIKFWLETLRTSNVSYEVDVDTDFNVTFGGQKVSRFSGSTLTRIVLSIRTAIFEVTCGTTNSSPRFFILDTPRQHDIAREDLARYVYSLRELSIRDNVQIIYSTTNHRYELAAGDAEWLPTFPGDRHPMFLGVVSPS